ncbi:MULTISPECIES: thermonuclease family protein [Cyanophyceae]|nr:MULTISPECIES: thermonuclease family protein [Cyanophyceae]
MNKLLNAFPLVLAGALIAYSCSQKGDRTASQNSQTSSNAVPPTSEVWKIAQTRDAIHDGDTMRLTNGSEELKVRFCGIDAPELKQQMGIAARDYLRSLVKQGGGQIYVVPIEKDRYGRTVAELFVPAKGKDDDIFLNGEMVRAGMAYHYQRYSGNCPNKNAIAVAEEMAKSAKAGVWRDPNSQKPWDWRKNNR